jgi:hypothetical protein
MATNGQLRRALAHARRNGWERRFTGAVSLASTRGIRSVYVEWDALHRNVRRVIERGPETFGQPRKVSIRRAITVLNATYDEHGNPIA